MKQFDVKWQFFTEADLEIKNTTKHSKPIYIILQDENWCLASEVLAHFHYRKKQRERK